MAEFFEKVILQMLEWPFLLAVVAILITHNFRKEITEAISRGRIILSWGDLKFGLSELPEHLNQNFAPIHDDIDDLKQRITALETTPASVKPDLDAKATEAARQRMLTALEESRYRWRSIERLSSIAGISVEQASEILRPMHQEVVFSRGKAGRTIVRLSSR